MSSRRVLLVVDALFVGDLERKRKADDNMYRLDLSAFMEAVVGSLTGMKLADPSVTKLGLISCINSDVKWLFNLYLNMGFRLRRADIRGRFLNTAVMQTRDYYRILQTAHLGVMLGFEASVEVAAEGDDDKAVEGVEENYTDIIFLVRPGVGSLAEIAVDLFPGATVYLGVSELLGEAFPFDLSLASKSIKYFALDNIIAELPPVAGGRRPFGSSLELKLGNYVKKS